MSRKPAVFIGSSVEGLDIAHTVQELLEFDCESTVWTQGVFKPSMMALADLYARTRMSELAIFIFTPDDEVVLRGEATRVPRDNVIFELGLFIGALEPGRCFIVQPRGLAMHLPTDLLGVTPLTYPADRSDKNLLAALGPACNQVRRAIRDYEKDSSVIKFSEDRRGKPIVDVRQTSLADYIAEWNGPLVDVRSSLGSVNFDPYDEETAALRPRMRRVFAFLDGLADAVLSGRIPEADAKAAFGETVAFTWPNLATLLAPANHVDDFWNPQPRLSELYVRWRDAK